VRWIHRSPRQLAVGRPAAPGRRPRRLDVRDPPGQAGPRRGAVPVAVARHRGGDAPRHGSHGGGRAISDPANRRWVARGTSDQDPGHAFTSSSAALPAFLTPSPVCPLDTGPLRMRRVLDGTVRWSGRGGGSGWWSWPAPARPEPIKPLNRKETTSYHRDRPQCRRNEYGSCGVSRIRRIPRSAIAVTSSKMARGGAVSAPVCRGDDCSGQRVTEPDGPEPASVACPGCGGACNGYDLGTVPSAL
jgi:hypothetical protein